MHQCVFVLATYPQEHLRRANDDVVDRDENQLHEEPDESHHDESDRRTDRDLRELFAIGLVAPLDEANAVLGEVSEGIDDRVNGFHGFSQRMWSFWEVLERESLGL